MAWSKTKGTKRREGQRDHDGRHKAHRAGFVRVRVHDGGKGWRLSCTVDGCGESRTFPWGAYEDPDRMVKFARGEGWRVDYDRPPLCPMHSPVLRRANTRPFEPGMVVMNGDVVTMPSIDEIVAVDMTDFRRDLDTARRAQAIRAEGWRITTTKEEPMPTPDETAERTTYGSMPAAEAGESVRAAAAGTIAEIEQGIKRGEPMNIRPDGTLERGPDLRLTLAVGRLLDEVFDAEKRTYRQGWTDQHVAKETGAAPLYVAKVRREAFGELAVDPELAALKGMAMNMGRDIVALGERQRALEGQLRNMNTRIEALERDGPK